MTTGNSISIGETLSDRTNRAKARWLNRVMHDPCATPIQKCVGYAVADHLNCATLDSWPAPATLALMFGRKVEKSILRAARGLQARGHIALNRIGGCYRYAPVFFESDWDTSVRKTGQSKSIVADKNDHESFLSIHIESDSTAGPSKRVANNGGPRFRRSERGAVELELAKMLGPDGMEVLSRLGEIDDHIVDRLCRALAEGSLGARELAAARLAARQFKPRRR